MEMNAGNSTKYALIKYKEGLGRCRCNCGIWRGCIHESRSYACSGMYYGDESIETVIYLSIFIKVDIKI